MPSQILPKPAVRSITISMFLMAGFTVAWSSIAAVGLAPAARVLVVSVFGLLSLLIGSSAVRFFVLAKQLPELSSKTDLAFNKRMKKAYRLVFSAEGVCIGVAAGLLNGFHEQQFVMPTIALIVGLHFIPMARIFHRTLDYYLSMLVVGASVYGLWLLKNTTTPLHTVWALVGLASAIATTIYGLNMWLVLQRAFKNNF